MRTFLLPALAAGLLAVPSGRAADDPRAVVEKAVRATGGEEALARGLAVRKLVKGTLHQLDGLTFAGESISQQPGQSKVILGFEVGVTKMSVVQVCNGDKAWARTNDEPALEADAQTLASMKTSLYVDHVMTLVPLLKDKEFTLTAAGAAKVEGRDAVGVKAARKGRTDVLLHFDKENGLLAQVEYRTHGEREGREVVVRAVCLDYRSPGPAADDERLLKAAGVGADGPALLEFVKKRTLSDEKLAAIKAMIDQLGDDDFEKREKAVAGLKEHGSLAAPLLREAARKADPEIKGRAEKCLKAVEDDAKLTAAAGAAVRLIGHRKPAGADEVLLAYLPGAADESVARDATAALIAVAGRDGKPGPAVEKALEDKAPARRAAAAAALGKDGGAFAKQPGRRVYTDGPKYAARLVYYRDDKKDFEWLVTDLQFYNRFDDAEFAKP